MVANIVEIGTKFRVTTSSDKDLVSWANVFQQGTTQLPKLSIPDALPQ